MDQISALAFFEEMFYAYSDRKPYQWQRDLFAKFLKSTVPGVIDLPTGTGKTSMMAIWYFALAWSKSQSLPLPLPRRLIWVVNRRVVVDQATDEAEKIQKFANARGLMVLNVSTLRGQLADNREWKAKPHEAAIVIGTVDMIGSRLLFMGYGDGAYWRPQHAGLMGVDALFVNDEAQLTPAFMKLLQSVQRIQPAEKIPGKQFRICELTATPISEADRFPDDMDALMSEDEAFRSRCQATKRLTLHAEADRAKAEKKLAELAMDAVAPRTIVFRESPENARSLAEKLSERYPNRVALLTGTMRGRERDWMVETNPTFQLFIRADAPAEPAWLVATSAAEVGVNITAERQITMLVEAGPLIQRFGRLNRFGGPRGEAHVVYSPVSDKEPRNQETLRWLQRLPEIEGAKDICAATLRKSDPPRAEEPIVAELHPWLVELWSQTSGSGRDRPYPPVWRWLHGKEDYRPQTTVVWRNETTVLAEALENGIVSEDDIENAFDFFPILPHERLSEPTKDVQDKLTKLASQDPTLRVLVIDRKGTIRFPTLAILCDPKSQLLEESTLLLSPGAGKLIYGMFKGEFDRDFVDHGALDVADEDVGGPLKREHLIGFKSEKRMVDTEERALPLFDSEAEESDEEVEERYLIYRRWKPAKAAAKTHGPYPLETHLAEVEVVAGEFANRSVPYLQAAYRQAGKLHDRGKFRNVWQEAMGGDPKNPVAKSMRPIQPKRLNGYRHELGSIVENPDEEDLVLHLIASHHGHARPYFGEKAHDPDHFSESQDQIKAAPERFARLTRQYGPWGLAYLEAIFKAADAEVSGQAETQTNG